MKYRFHIRPTVCLHNDNELGEICFDSILEVEAKDENEAQEKVFRILKNAVLAWQYDLIKE